MKILHVLLSLDPDYGGPAHSAPSLAAAQASLGHEVSLAFYEHEDAKAFQERGAKSIPGLNRVCLIPLGPRDLLEGVLPRRAQARLDDLVPSVDVVHLHDMWQPLLGLSARLARAANVPYVISPRGALNAWSLKQKRIKKALALSLEWRSLLEGAAYLHALNQQEAEQLKNLGLSSPVLIAPNGMFPAPTSHTPGVFRSRHESLENRRYVLFLSRLHVKKGLDILIRAFSDVAATFPDVDLVVAGPDEGAEASLRADIVHHNLQRRVHLVGPLYGPEKQAALHDAAVFCLPSRDEGFSMAVLEAMAAGLPVVISEHCNFPEAMARDAAVACSLEPAALAAALGKLLLDEGMRTRIAENGQRLVEAEYTWNVIASQTIKGYAEHR